MRRIGVALVAVLLALTGEAGAVPARAAGCTAATYVGLLRDSLDALTASPPDYLRARAPLDQILVDDTSYRQMPVHVEIGPILSDLDASPANTSDAIARLQAVTSALSVPPGAACSADQSAARDQLHRIYNGPAFAGLDATPQPSILERIGRAISDAVSSVIQGVGGGPILVLLALIVGLVLALVVRRLMSSSRQGAPVEAPEALHGVSDDPDVEWAAAYAAAAAGEYREAIRRGFRSALLALALRGRLRVNPAWTTRELLGRASSDSQLMGLLAAAAAEFDRAWYSGAAVDADDWERTRAQCAAIRALGLPTARAA